jgi:hypothetical protein
MAAGKPKPPIDMADRSASSVRPDGAAFENAASAPSISEHFRM